MDDFTVLSEVKKLGLQKKLADMGVQPAKLQVGVPKPRANFPFWAWHKLSQLTSVAI